MVTDYLRTWSSPAVVITLAVMFLTSMSFLVMLYVEHKQLKLAVEDNRLANKEDEQVNHLQDDAIIILQSNQAKTAEILQRLNEEQRTMRASITENEKEAMQRFLDILVKVNRIEARYQVP